MASRIEYGMQPRSVEKDEQRSMRAYKIVFYICAAVMILITAYALAESTREYLATGKVVIGEVLVNTEFPMKGSVKLVSYLMIVSVVGWFCIMKLGSKKTENTSQTVRSILRLVVLGIAVITFYEFIYNFVIWNALMTADAISGILRIDMLKIEYPSTTTPWNLVFATKMFLAAFVISAHAFYVLSRPDSKVLSEQV
ncbi:MAG: hypothetical protein HMLIMOIP_001055 [Candidatus Nitrosomirales archaeon]|jgi:hypothetical protein